jgi:hypothetical protein
MTTTIKPNIKISDRDAIYEAKIAGKVPELIRGILRRRIIEQEVTKAGIEPSVTELQLAADKFRIVNRLESAEATKQWLEQRLLSLDDFEYMITQNLLCDKLAVHLFGIE